MVRSSTPRDGGAGWAIMRVHMGLGRMCGARWARFRLACMQQGRTQAAKGQSTSRALDAPTALEAKRRRFTHTSGSAETELSSY